MVDKKYWCYKHVDGWCATRRKYGKYQDNVKTVCGMVVVLPLDIAFRVPTCKDCIRELDYGRR